MLIATIQIAGRFIVQFCYIYNTIRGIKSFGVDMCKIQATGKLIPSLFPVYA